MSKLSEVIAELKATGLLDRAAFIKAGDVEVQLGPPQLSVETSTGEEITPEDEALAFKQTMYGAARGATPGVD